MKKLVFLSIVFLIITGISSAEILLRPVCNPEDVLIDIIEVGGVLYHTISIDAFPLPMSGEQAAGSPEIPYVTTTYLLPPDIMIDDFEIISASWDTLSGKYYIYPAQTGSLEDTTFTLPDPEIYSSSEPFPSLPVALVGQGSASGYSVVSFSGTPVRYIPADSLLMVLTSVVINLSVEPSEFDRVVPSRENEWSASVRQTGIRSLVMNPEDLIFYPPPNIISRGDNKSPLNVLEFPSPEGDGVDMVIITSEENPDLTGEGAFRDFSEYRISQGIVTVIKSVEWIEQTYSGCDTQERIRNFICDAHENWGTHAVLLGGDDHIVPVRECYTSASGYSNQHPADDYYADVDGDWHLTEGESQAWWRAPDENYYVDLILGRWPVDDAADFQTLYNKLKLYECPDEFPENYARKMLLLGGIGANRLEALKDFLEEAGAIPGNLVYPTELYYPGLLNRQAALEAFNEGHQIIIHSDHCGTHAISVPRDYDEGPSQYIYEYDFDTITNTGKPSIFFTIGCWPGHFENADCFAEAGLLTSTNTGFVAAIANARSGWSGDWEVYYSLINALYPFGWLGHPEPQYPVPPVCYLGEAYRYSMNHAFAPENNNNRLSYMNLLGDPSMYVWRNDPSELTVITMPSMATAGTFNVLVTVRETGAALHGATVCLWKENDVFAMETTGANGTAFFEDVSAAHPGEILVTASKRVHLDDLVNYLPETASITVLGSNQPLVCLESFLIDDAELPPGSEGNDDGVANPGETIELDLQVSNTGLNTATGVEAVLSLSSGEVQILQNSVYIGTIPGSATIPVDDAFRLEILDAESYSPVLLEVSFTYNEGSWVSPCNFSIFSDEIQLPVRDVQVTYDPVENNTFIDVTDILAVNSGLGGAEEVLITAANFSQEAVFEGDNTSYAGTIAPNQAKDVSDPVSLVCYDPPANWQGQGFIDCSFDLVITDRWEREFIVSVDVEALITAPQMELPEDFINTELGQNYINVEWEWNQPWLINGFYLYYKQNGSPLWNRMNVLPVPVCQGTFTGLQPSTLYDLAVSAVDNLGRESQFCGMDDPVSTVCQMIPGWPVQLDGNTGTGPLVVDIDLDDFQEVIAATSMGHVCIIERDGSFEIIDNRDDYTLTGCAVGDVFPGNRPEIVVSGWSFDDEHAAIIVYEWENPIQGWIGTVVEANSAPGNGESIHSYLSSPVLFQADRPGSTLEIALRTFNFTCGGQNSWLYVWQHDIQNDWTIYSNFPVTREDGEWDYASPVFSDDLDNDGSVELIVSAGSGLLESVELNNGSETIWDIGQYLPQRGSDNAPADWILGQATLAVLKQDNEKTYVVGVARNDLGGIHNKADFIVFCWNASDEILEWYQPEPPVYYSRYDHFGNCGGPAIGDIDGDGSLDVLKHFANTHGYDDEFLGWWQLSDGTCTGTILIDRNPHQEDIAVAPTTLAGRSGEGMAASMGYSTCGYSVQSTGGELELAAGFPYWSEDLHYTASCFGDIDNDGLLEILFSDDSGLLAFLDWNIPSAAGGWPVFGHDPMRTGNYNFQAYGGDTEKLDFIIISVKPISNRACEASSGPDVFQIEVNVIGSGIQISPEISSFTPPQLQRLAEDDETFSSVQLQSSLLTIDHGNEPVIGIQKSGPSLLEHTDMESVEVLLLCGTEIIGRGEIPVCDGLHRVIINTYEQGRISGDITAVVDPADRFLELDETNNSARAAIEVTGSGTAWLSVPSPASSITINMESAELLAGGITVRVFSIDGRLIVREHINYVPEGYHVIELPDSQDLPAGVYTVVIKGFGNDELTRRVVLLP